MANENVSVFPVRTDQAEWSVGADNTMTVKDTSSGWFFPLNEVGTIVWDMLDGSNSIDDIALAVCEEFEVEPEVAKDDVQEFVQQAEDLNLISWQ